MAYLPEFISGMVLAGKSAAMNQASTDIWIEITNQAREAEQRAVVRQIEFIQFLSTRVDEWHKRTEALAFAMWDASGRPQGQAFDNWLESEQQVWGPLRHRIQQTAYYIWESAGKQQGKALEDWLQAQQAVFLPLFKRTRESADSMWKLAGEPLGRALEFWVSAEKQVLDSLSAAQKRISESPDDQSEK